MADSRKTILIIGGAGGIGKAAAVSCMQKGFQVLIVDRDPQKLDLCKSELRDCGVLLLDINDRSSVRKALAEAKASYGALDAVVIAAAVHSTYPVEYLPDEVIHQVLETNLVSHIKLVRDCLPLLKDGGKVLGISSIAAGVGIPFSSLYSASKAGLEMFYESLQNEISYRGIRCVVIHPGNVNTGFNETGNDYKPQGNAFVDEAYRKIVAKIDSRYGIAPQKVADVIVRALENPNPRFCYVVGMNALKAVWAKRLLGRDMALRVMAKFFGIEPEKK